MIQGNFYSKVSETVQDAISFGAGLAISLLLVGFLAFYSITATVVLLLVCSTVVFITGILILYFTDKKYPDEDTEIK